MIPLNNLHHEDRYFFYIEKSTQTQDKKVEIIQFKNETIFQIKNNLGNIYTVSKWMVEGLPKYSLLVPLEFFEMCSCRVKRFSPEKEYKIYFSLGLMGGMKCANLESSKKITRSQSTKFVNESIFFSSQSERVDSCNSAKKALMSLADNQNQLAKAISQHKTIAQADMIGIKEVKESFNRLHKALLDLADGWVSLDNSVSGFVKKIATFTSLIINYNDVILSQLEDQKFDQQFEDCIDEIIDELDDFEKKILKMEATKNKNNDFLNDMIVKLNDFSKTCISATEELKEENIEDCRLIKTINSNDSSISKKVWGSIVIVIGILAALPSYGGSLTLTAFGSTMVHLGRKERSNVKKAVRNVQLRIDENEEEISSINTLSEKYKKEFSYIAQQCNHFLICLGRAIAMQKQFLEDSSKQIKKVKNLKEKKFIAKTNWKTFYQNWMLINVGAEYYLKKIETSVPVISTE